MKKTFFLACLFSILLSPIFALEVIIDNDNTTNCLVVGTWNTSTSSCYGANKFTHPPGTGTDKVTWNATLPSGWYVVYFRMNSNTTYSTAAKYSIVHRDGTANLTINQQRGSSGWFVLGGAYYFDGSASVTLTDEFDASTGTYVIADGIRFWSAYSFVQMSDTHAGYGAGNTQGQAIANELKTLGKVTMATYGIDAPPPSFAFHSGDMTEFGRKYWSTFTSMFSGMPFPIYYSLGNHDSTWNSLREPVSAVNGGPYYSFDFIDRGTKFHFINLDSSITQSPRSSFTREELDWLKADLAALDPGTPVFIQFHHPIQSTTVSDPKVYDQYRFFEIIRPYNVTMCLVGHGHSSTQWTVDGVQFIEGGSTYNDSTGTGCYNIITVLHNSRYYAAKKIYGEATAATGLRNNITIQTGPTYPVITVTAPEKDSIQTASTVNISASIGSGTVTAADFDLNGDGTWRAMTGSGNGPYTGSINLSSATHGRFWIRVRFTMSSGGPYYKIVPFWFWDGYPKPRWIFDMGAASLSTPAIDNGKVYVGANGGAFFCINARYGYEVWRVNLPNDILSSPVVDGGNVYVGCGDGNLYCLNANTGTTVWKKALSGPVYSSPTIEGDNVYIGCNGTGASNSAYIYSLNKYTGNQNWRYAVGDAIESKPFVLNGVVYAGSWDSYLYAVNTNNGTLKWRYRHNTGSIPQYYSPANSWPVASASANRVFVADREYYFSAVNISTGTADWEQSGVSAQCLTPDGTALLIRDTSGYLKRITFDNATVWQASCSLDSDAAGPLCNGTRAVVTDQDGLISVVNLSNGAIQYQFFSNRGYELHPVNIDSDGNAYASTYEGYLICVSNSALPANTVPDIVLESRDNTGALTPNPPYLEDTAGNVWVDNGAKSIAPGLIGLGSRYNSITDGLTGKCTITPNIVTAGYYDVFVTWSIDANAENVSYTVKHIGGDDTVVLTQKPADAPGGTNGNTWIKLGNFGFNEGQNTATGSITVDESTVTGAHTSYNTGRVYSDGYLFVYTGALPPPSSIDCWYLYNK